MFVFDFFLLQQTLRNFFFFIPLTLHPSIGQLGVHAAAAAADDANAAAHSFRLPSELVGIVRAHAFVFLLLCVHTYIYIYVY